jgi:putative ABC transport system permease protein
MQMAPELPTTNLTVENRPARTDESSDWGVESVVTSGYFASIGIPVIEGRPFQLQDSQTSVLVTVISRGLAERYWPEQTAIGHRLKLGLDDSSDPWRTVVGIVGDVRRFDPTTPPPPQLYLPLSQQPIRSLTYFVTTEDEPDAHADAVRASVWKVDPQQPVEDLRTLEEAVDELYAGVELGEHMLTALGIIAVILAASGIYSVFSYSIARR